MKSEATFSRRLQHHFIFEKHSLSRASHYSLELWDPPDQRCHKECRLHSQAIDTSSLPRMREKPVKGIGNTEVGC